MQDLQQDRLLRLSYVADDRSVRRGHIEVGSRSGGAKDDAKFLPHALQPAH